MKNIAKLLVLILILIIGMVGIATANPDPCPSLNAWGNKATSNIVTVVSELISGNQFQYKVGGPGPATDNIGAQEVCVAKSGANFLSETVEAKNWQVDTPGNPPYVQFHRLDGQPNNILFDGTLHDVGTITWDKDPRPENILVHILDPAECTKLYPNGDPDSPASGTCFVKPNGPNPPIPELSTIVLTSTGILGLIMVSRKYRKN